MSNEIKNCIKQQINYSENEILLYDFNKNRVGDSLFANCPIIDIDSVWIHNTYRKRYKIQDDYVVEGIGSVKQGLFGYITSKPMCSYFSWEFLCFSQNAETVFKNPAYMNCNSTEKWSDPDYLKTGTQWYYGEIVYPFGTPTIKYDDFNSLKSIGDTIINNLVCHKLNHVRNRPTCYGYEQQVYIYQSNDTVYFLNSNTKKFSTLYVYGANEGDSWTVNYPQGAVKVQVDSISSLWTMAQWLKVQYVTYSMIFPNSGGSIFTHSSKIIEGIGDENYYFNSFIFYRPFCDDFSWFPNGLRCYVHPDYGTYHVPGTLDCSYVTAVPNQKYSSLKVIINSSGIMSIEGELGAESNTFELLDIKGSVIMRTQISSDKNTINMSGFTKGLYMYRISNNGMMMKSGKVVKL
jgi:hypothetical protein